MAHEDEAYDEVDAVVRIPKGERLASSKKSDGWSRGFTPKTSEKGPEHVEIRLKDDAEAEPEIVYVTEYANDGRSQLTPGQQFFADLIRQALDGLIEISKPMVLSWWETQVVPAMATKRENFVQKRQARKAQKLVAATSTAPAASRVVQAEASSQEVAVDAGTAKVTVTSEQFQQLFTTWLAREEAQEALWNLIVSAEVEDADTATLDWQQSLNELSPDERSARVLEFISANPSILEELGRRILQGILPQTAARAPGGFGE